MHVWLTHSDGMYRTRALTEDEAKTASRNGCTVVWVREEVWAAWQVHLQQSAVFDTMWTMLDNEKFNKEI
jgi:hypothetical protein